MHKDIHWLGFGYRQAWATAILLVLMLSFASGSFAAPPKRIELDYLAVRVQADEAALVLSLSVDDLDGLGELLKDGANIELKAEAIVRQKRQLWVDSELTRQTFTWHLSHDHLTREFILQSSQTPDARPQRERNLERLLQGNWQGLVLPVLSAHELADIQKNKEYYVLLTLTLVFSEIPPWLEKSPVLGKTQIVPKTEYTLPLFIQVQ